MSKTSFFLSVIISFIGFLYFVAAAPKNIIKYPYGNGLTLGPTNSNGYACYHGINGRDSNVVTQSCEKQAQLLFQSQSTKSIWQNAARQQGYRYGDEAKTQANNGGGPYITLPPGKSFQVPAMDACSYTITNIGNKAINAHAPLNGYAPQFIFSNCQKFSDSNIQPGLTASFGGVLTSNLGLKYDVKGL